MRDQLTALNQDQLANLYKKVFDGVDGQLVFQDLKDRCFYHVSTVNGQNSVHSNEVIYKEGMRSVILHIETNLNTETKE